MTHQLQTGYAATLSIGLLAIGVWHVLAGAATEQIFRQTRAVRAVGILLLALAVPCFVWRSPYFLTLGILLTISGALRALTPGLNVRVQKRAYPRWVHGWIMATGAVIAAVTFFANWPAH